VDAALERRTPDLGPGRRSGQLADGWPELARTFHSLRHVFATWALHEARIPIEDLSRLMGHSSTRVTQDIYVHVRDDIFDRRGRNGSQRCSESWALCIGRPPNESPRMSTSSR
jgi:hypothetical protein